MFGDFIWLLFHIFFSGFFFVRLKTDFKKDGFGGLGLQFVDILVGGLNVVSAILRLIMIVEKMAG